MVEFLPSDSGQAWSQVSILAASHELGVVAYPWSIGGGVTSFLDVKDQFIDSALFN